MGLVVINRFQPFLMLGLLLIGMFCPVVLSGYVTEDIWVPTDCDGVVEAGDHLLIEYSLHDFDGVELYAQRPPNNRLHIIASEDETSIVHKTMKGMCRNATRRMSFDSPPEEESLSGLDAGFAMDQIATLSITVVHLTDPVDFEIFKHIDNRDENAVYQMLKDQRGVRAVNEEGQSSLMQAVEMETLSCFSFLLNARKPMVDVNFAKPSGHTAIFYAVNQKNALMLKALLQRGADPTVALVDSKMTPLHLACMLESREHVALLIQYGADANAKDAKGLLPIQHLSQNTPRGIKLIFKKIFETTSVNMQRPKRVKTDEL